MSVDIVGSTAFKQTAKGPAAKDGTKPQTMQAWVAHFSSFFTRFTQTFAQTWDDSWNGVPPTISKTRGSHCPIFWKAAGDEALYTLDLENQNQAVIAISAFRKAMERCRDAFQEQQETSHLDLKGTAWLAGFPVNNVEIVINFIGDDLPSNANKVLIGKNNLDYRILSEAGYGKNVIKDYIGPQIDLGFRLSRLSSPRRLIISADLAALLACTHDDSWPKTHAPLLYFSGTEPLKGVLSGTPYPVLWCDAQPEDELHKCEDMVRGRTLASKEYIHRYCVAFMKKSQKHHPWMITPFIKDKEGKVIWGEEPEAHRIEFTNIEAAWDDAAHKIFGIEPQEPAEPAKLTGPSRQHLDFLLQAAPLPDGK